MPSEAPGQVTGIPFSTDLLGLHGLDTDRYPALIESATDDSRLGRFDILFAFPELSLRLAADGTLSGSAAAGHSQFLKAFDSTWHAHRRTPVPGGRRMPFDGGWFVLLGYELANEVEPGLRLRTDPRQPVAVALRIPVALIRDRSSASAWIVAEPGHEASIALILADIERLAAATAPAAPRGRLVETLEATPAARFLATVERAQERIAAGDIYQANLSREWAGRLRAGVRPVDVYAALRRTNPAPFAGIASVPGMTVISSSPERLLRTDGRRIETRPIAGTRPRAAGAGADEEVRRALRAHPKERAEHVMLIDLERNDLGRVCKPGTVEVDEFMAIESYAHVHHLVSNVRGELRADATPGTIVRAVFPGGSITGCPKVRCMQIISELERRPRGVYTGAMGYIGCDGSADLNILIRSIVVTGRDVSVATGSGIVADSNPQHELDETRAKARGLLLALGHTDAG